MIVMTTTPLFWKYTKQYKGCSGNYKYNSRSGYVNSSVFNTLSVTFKHKTNSSNVSIIVPEAGQIYNNSLRPYILITKDVLYIHN
jgi:hypothetical protein